MEMALTYYSTFNLFSFASIVVQIFLIIFFIVAIFLGRTKDGQKEQLNGFQKIENSQ